MAVEIGGGGDSQTDGFAGPSAVAVKTTNDARRAQVKK